MGRNKTECEFTEGMKFKWGVNDQFFAVITGAKKMENETMLVMKRHDSKSGEDTEVNFMANSLQDKINKGMIKVVSEEAQSTSEYIGILEEE